ncbi:MAG: SprT-like domain-containing protein [Gemmatimonadaceae bacterium]
MLQALTRFFRGTRDAAQLELSLPDVAPKNADELLAKLRTLGLHRITGCRLTHNRNVMVSFTNGVLRVHEGYLDAPEAVLRAIVSFVEGRTRAERKAAQQVIITYPIRSQAAPAQRRERTHPDDLAMVEQLSAWHARYNARHFHGALKPVAVRVSRRMKSRLGHYSAAAPGGADAEIAISRRHLRRHGWTEALHTLLHEMVHQWQDETGHTIDHSSTFRAKCRDVGIAPYARRVLVPAREHMAQQQLARGA